MFRNLFLTTSFGGEKKFLDIKVLRLISIFLITTYEKKNYPITSLWNVYKRSS